MKAVLESIFFSLLTFSVSLTVSFHWKAQNQVLWVCSVWRIQLDRWRTQRSSQVSAFVLNKRVRFARNHFNGERKAAKNELWCHQQVHADDSVRSGRSHSSLEDIQTGLSSYHKVFKSVLSCLRAWRSTIIGGISFFCAKSIKVLNMNMPSSFEAMFEHQNVT